MDSRNTPKLTVVLGIVLLIIAYLIPYDSLESLLGQGLRPLGLVSLFINPVLGIIGGIFSFLKKQWLYLILNIVIIFSFFVIMAIGYSL
ncbi:hypothetical protein [Desulfosporosinus nitroreducens]|uniref:Uncharacterized protein n=1 Tax=Desulfosporosinus nitroreducens TaxID=2018668 RepID=A0ABT8QXG9_9FIRM|nr:hypothetical protein [Desulfosporosinus nitroreducens]MDO0826044.1 hypothetical protein [Desulfosporosinus nitroreducens]